MIHDLVTAVGLAFFLFGLFVFISAVIGLFRFDYVLNRMHAAAVFCGDNFTFGRGGAGNVALLQTLCGEKGITVTVVPMERWGGSLISSTRIRELLLAGEMEQAQLREYANNLSEELPESCARLQAEYSACIQ